MTSLMTKTEADALAKKLRSAAHSYYTTGASPLSDADYDDGVESLKSSQFSADYTDLYDTAVASGQGTAAPSDGDDVVHAVPMMSLAKAYEPEEVSQYCVKMAAAGATGFKLQAKFDGMSASMLYVDGILTTVSSRGNGNVGKDMSHLITSTEVSVSGMPKHIDTTHHLVEVRGELLLRHSDFAKASAARQKATGEPFESYRNANAGIVNGSKKGLGYAAHLTFVAYRVIVDGAPENTAPMYEATLPAWGFDTADAITSSEWGKVSGTKPTLDFAADKVDDLLSSIKEYGSIRDSLDISNDGIVIKPENEDAMDAMFGSTAHHPISQLAFKFKGVRVTVTIRDVVWSVGKQGQVTPVLVYDPVELEESINDRATIHNASFLREYDLRRGGTALIERAGGVIPHFLDVVTAPEEAERFVAPTLCPVCSTPLDITDTAAICPNPQCPARMESVLNAAASRHILDIDGMGETIVSDLIRTGALTDIASLFELTRKDLETIGYKKKAVTIIEEIEKAKTLPFPRLLALLSINGVGVRMGTILERNGITSIDALRNMTVEGLSAIPGFGTVRAELIVAWFADESNVAMLERMRTAGVVLGNPVVAENAPTVAKNATVRNPLIDGKRFSITGSVPQGYANRDEFVSMIENNGGFFSSTPNKKTDYVIGDESSSSSKMKKAIALRDAGQSITILSPEGFGAAFAK